MPMMDEAVADSHARLRLLHRVNLNVYGGVENQFVQFMNHPGAAAAVAHHVVVGEPAHALLRDDLQRGATAVYSFKNWHALKLPRRPTLLRNRNLQRIVRVSRADAVLAWSAFGRPELGRACANEGVPLIHREGGGAWFAHEPDRVEAFLKQLAGAVCNTQASRRMLQLRWGYAGPARVCLAGVRPDSWRPGERPIRAANVPIRLGAVARLVPLKGLCLSLHALAELVSRGLDCELHIAGEGPDAGRLRALADTLKISGRVKFYNVVNDMAGFYQALDVLVHPALREPLGNVSIEAGANGCPVVVARVDGLPETLEEGLSGFSVAATEPLEKYREYGGSLENMPSQVYDPGSDSLRAPHFVHPANLAQAVAAVVQDAQQHLKMSHAARAFVHRKFSFDVHVNAMLEAIYQFAGRA